MPKPKLLLVFDKKPRQGKTCKDYVYKDLKVVCRSTKTDTGNSIQIVHNQSPFPLIKMIPAKRNFDETFDEAKRWIALKYDEILVRLRWVDSIPNININVYLDSLKKKTTKEKAYENIA